MRRIQIIFVLALILLFVLPYSIFALDYSDVLTLEYSKIEALIMERSPTVKENIDAYEKAVVGKEDGVAALNTAIIGMETYISTFPNDGSDNAATIVYLLNLQRDSLVQQAASLQKQDFTKMSLGNEMGNYILVWNIQQLYITYNSLDIQIKDMKNKLSLMTKQYDVAIVQKELGMTTELNLKTTLNQLKELGLLIQQLENSQQKVKQTININISQEFDTDMKIGEVPKIDIDFVNSIDVDSDYNSSYYKSYNTRLNNDTLNKLANERKIFKKDFYGVYQTLLERLNNYELEKMKMTVAEKSMRIVELKHELGIISQIGYETEINSSESKKSTMETAEFNLFQAYQAYQWAKKGLIVNSGSGAS